MQSDDRVFTQPSFSGGQVTSLVKLNVHSKRGTNQYLSEYRKDHIFDDGGERSEDTTGHHS